MHGCSLVQGAEVTSAVLACTYLQLILWKNVRKLLSHHLHSHFWHIFTTHHCTNHITVTSHACKYWSSVHLMVLPLGPAPFTRSISPLHCSLLVSSASRTGWMNFDLTLSTSSHTPVCGITSWSCDWSDLVTYSVIRWLISDQQVPQEVQGSHYSVQITHTHTSHLLIQHTAQSLPVSLPQKFLVCGECNGLVQEWYQFWAEEWTGDSMLYQYGVTYGAVWY